MVTQGQFGRRNGPQRQPLGAMAEFEAALPRTKSAFTEVPVDQPSLAQTEITSARVDHELREWKQARKQQYKIPWRQLSLMASLCFGIASLVLPDSINENLDWLLYGLMAASLYAGLSRRWRL
jgi:hypothetical protein